VPRYYFNLTLGEGETVDLVGQNCPDDVTALKEAMRTAGEVVRNQLFFNRHEDGWIEVENEDHCEIMRLPLRAAAY
jgi:hypothetical protein